MTGVLPGSCSATWDDPTLPAWGSAPTATFVVALEQPGPWGAKAFTQSNLDPTVGAALEAACARAGGRPFLIRVPERQSDHRDHRAHTVFIAGGLRDHPWVVRGEVADAATLLELPFHRLATLTPDEAVDLLGWPLADAVLLVCANGKRDVCCALAGRGLAAQVAKTHPGQVWEASHLGGHRYAPTAFVLPTGVSLGRLAPALARDALDAAASGLVSASSLDDRSFRGRSCLSPVEQVADAAVRFATGERVIGALTVAVSREGAEVTHLDGRTWEVTASMHRLPDDLPVSCGKPPEAAVIWRASVRER